MLRRHAGCLQPRSARDRVRHALRRFSSAAGAGARGAGALLAFRPHLHRGEFHRQGGRAARCRGAGAGHRRARYQPARAEDSGRRRELRFRPGRRILRRRHSSALVARLPDVFLRHEGIILAVESAFAVDPARTGIFGHSMGGHGALTIALKNPAYYKSVSAFAPICSAMRCPWGEKALTGYLGADRALWRDYDATALIESRGWKGPTLRVDQGTDDQFLQSQLKPELLEEACRRAGVPLDLRLQAGYDHSYFFIASFIDDHLRFHARNLERS